MSEIKLYHGDCLEIMKNISDKSIDVILTDLPYGATNCSWDIILPFEDLWKNYNRIIKDNGVVLLFGNEPFSSYLRLSNIKNYKYDIYWQKERLTNIMQVKKRVGKNVEIISVFYKKQPTYNPQMIKFSGKLVSNKVKNGKLGKLIDSGNKKLFEYKDNGLRYPTQIWKFNRDSLKLNLHPTQKPLLLIEELIKTFSNESDVVLDSCMGSGTTGVACKLLNRDFIGIEIDEKYFNIAKRRIEGVNHDKN